MIAGVDSVKTVLQTVTSYWCTSVSARLNAVLQV